MAPPFVRRPRATITLLVAPGTAFALAASSRTSEV
jgi:hypothetical protein